MRRLAEIITSLSGNDRQLLRAYTYSDRAHWTSYVSEALGINDNNARVKLHRIKSKLGQKLSGNVQREQLKQAFVELDRTEPFNYDVFLSHSSKDKAVVRLIAERLRADGLRVWFDEWEIKPGDSIPAKIEEGLERSRVLVLCMSANAFGSDWSQLESGTFRFRDPLNKERRFIPLRLDDAPIKGSLAQFLYIDWCQEDRESAYAKLLEA